MNLKASSFTRHRYFFIKNAQKGVYPPNSARNPWGSFKV